MESIGTLAGGIAHDFNNLLMGIQGHASLALLLIDPQTPGYDHLKTIETLVVNGADLTKQLLGFARGGKYEVKTVDLNSLIYRTSEIIGRTKKEITIHHNLADDLGWQTLIRVKSSRYCLIFTLMPGRQCRAAETSIWPRPMSFWKKTGPKIIMVKMAIM